MATVYLARDLKTNEIVAVKILHSEYAENENYVKRFLKEAEIAIRMRHENIARVRDFGEENGTYFIVMEYVQGKTLARILEEKGKLPYEEVVRIAKEVAKALGYAHSKGLVAHRDIKPQNIMITAHGKVKVMDFGIAKLSGGEGLTSPDTVLGTPFYMSPEQAKGKPADIRSDLYALGITMYQMLTGKVPFSGDTPWSVISMHLTSEVPPISDTEVPEELKRIIYKLLEKDPGKRYQTPELLLKDLSKITPKEREETGGETVILNRNNLQKEAAKETPAEDKSGKERREGHGETVVLQNEGQGVSAEEVSAHSNTDKEESSGAVQHGTVIINKSKPLESKKALQKIPHVHLGNPLNFNNILQNKILTGAIALVLVALIGVLVFASAHHRNSIALQNSGTSQTNINTNGDIQAGSTGTGSSGGIGSGSGSGETSTETNENGSSGIIVKKVFTISVDSTPPGAEIFINGKDEGVKTPSKIKVDSAGTYVVSVKKEGYRSAEKTVTVSSGKTVKVVFTLKKLGGFLSITSIPSGAEIFIDGRDKGIKTPNMVNVPEGSHVVALKMNGYKVASKKVEVKNGETVNLKFTLQKAVAKLKIVSSPPGAEIFINGKDEGVKTPHSFSLPYGEYTITLKKSGYNDYKKTVSLYGDKTLSATLKKAEILHQFKNDAYAFSYLDGWKVIENPDEDTDVEVDSPSFADDYIGTCYIYHDNLKDEGISEEELLKEVKENLLDNEKVVEEKDVLINGQVFHKLVVTGSGTDNEGNNANLKIAMFFLKKGDIIYTLEFDATPQDFDKAWHGFAIILYSFRVLNP